MKKVARPELCKFASLISKLNGHQKARVAELAVTVRLLIHGFEVFDPVIMWSAADLLVALPSSKRVVRVQVKWAR